MGNNDLEMAAGSGLSSLQGKTGERPALMKHVVDIDEGVQDFVRFRMCWTCKTVRPPRSHHCSICKRCVMRMDHHCPWTGNCIGLKNHKFFICFMFWTIVACLYVVLSSPLLCHKITLANSREARDFLMSHTVLNPMLAIIISMGVALGVSILLVLHLCFISRNETTIESGEFLMRGGNPFRLGRKDNFE
mmetsp:Transcript_4852/g.8318  ORF Transcript_4852/g.8318 Transcript_4852/m.8318 type:complete len:190 (+) Transcript_4852:702-1271(+)